MRLPLAALSATTLAFALAFPTTALANGRFPESNAVFITASDPDLILLRVTFGLVVSHDRGITWDLACEQAIGVTGVEDPMFTVTPAGTFVASTFQGMSISRDKACSFEFSQGNIKDYTFIDLTTRKADPSRIVSLASAYDRQDENGVVFLKNELWETHDDAVTFARIGAPLDSSLLVQTVDLTEADENRIYVSGDHNVANAASSTLLVSRDRGLTWEANAIPLQGAEQSTFIAAVDPTNADRVYVRTTSIDTGSFDGGAPSSRPGRVMVTDDAGKTWRTIFQGQSPLPGFALTADGSKIYIGGPKDGLQVASTSDFVFTQTSTMEVGCLAIGPDGLWTCSNERSGFVLGITKDEGKTFESRLRFCEIRGALQCPADSEAATKCAPTFPAQSAVLGCQPFPEVDAGEFDGGLGSSGGIPGGNGADAEDSGGCNCTVEKTKPMATLTALMLSGVCAALFVSRRRRS